MHLLMLSFQICSQRLTQPENWWRSNLRATSEGGSQTLSVQARGGSSTLFPADKYNYIHRYYRPVTSYYLWSHVACAACIMRSWAVWIILHVNSEISLQIVQHSAFSSCDSSSDATMSTYKLTYFPIRARAEVIRFVFAQAEVKYEDVRIKKEDWAELKPSKLAFMYI